ncbi:hypothetical protein FB451DRAFT_1178468 [Mycena latifolia]|nr:hypothetical protein FB451DRAFT_1178468 [Mycena latifolia]
MFILHFVFLALLLTGLAANAAPPHTHTSSGNRVAKDLEFRDIRLYSRNSTAPAILTPAQRSEKGAGGGGGGLVTRVGLDSFLERLNDVIVPWPDDLRKWVYLRWDHTCFLWVACESHTAEPLFDS